MILCLDCGNSRLKWGIRHARSWLACGTDAPGELAGYAIERVLACNVAGPAGQAKIEAVAAATKADIEWLTSSRQWGDVINDYEHPGQLGADRWAALLGARGCHRGNCLVVMSGTATTLDVLSANGRFCGGAILPGLDMMRTVLAAGTANLPVVAGRVVDRPRNTADAIASGCVQATVGAIERMYRQIEGMPDSLCILSGGAAAVLAPLLSMPMRRMDNLVLEGLARVAENIQ